MARGLTRHARDYNAGVENLSGFDRDQAKFTSPLLLHEKFQAVTSQHRRESVDDQDLARQLLLGDLTFGEPGNFLRQRHLPLGQPLRAVDVHQDHVGHDGRKLRDCPFDIFGRPDTDAADGVHQSSDERIAPLLQIGIGSANFLLRTVKRIPRSPTRLHCITLRIGAPPDQRHIRCATRITLLEVRHTVILQLKSSQKFFKLE